jgi:hypothetical protein
MSSPNSHSEIITADSCRPARPQTQNLSPIGYILIQSDAYCANLPCTLDVNGESLRIFQCIGYAGEQMSQRVADNYCNVFLADLNRPAPKAVLARDPTARLGYGSCTGWFTSRKCRVRWPFESLLERDALVVLEADQRVADYAAQPETFQVRATGTRYTPDLLVEYTNGRRLFREVKPAAKVRVSPALTRHLDQVVAACAARGAHFDVWTDDDIRREPRLSNSHRVTKSVAFVSANALQFVWGLEQGDGLTLAQAASELPEAGPIARSAILGLVGLGLLHADLERSLTDDTVVRRI